MTFEEVLKKYQPVIGLEVHAQLMTKTKAYSSDINEYGSAPNTNVSPTSLGHPGTLPRANKSVIEYAVRLGLATESDIRKDMFYARKNYFYPDLPKGYQITQDKTPICENGKIQIKLDGKRKDIRLIRIHMEEDAGKSMHDQDPFNTLVDLNRAGVALVEIVSHPDISSGEEAYAYLTEVRKLVRYLDICDGNMEEGSLRCDANISIMPIGSTEYGNRVEVKNMNSIRNVQRAIEFEICRQAEIYEKGGSITTETRSYNAVNNTTISMRGKEDAHDYRYFPEPDMLPLKINQEYIDKVESLLPPLPNHLFDKYVQQLKLSEYDAQVLTDTKEIALYYEEICEHTENYKSAANWVQGDVKSYLNQQAISMDEFPVKAANIAGLISLIDEGKINNSIAKQKIFPEMILNPEQTAEMIAKSNNWIQDSDESSIEQWVKDAIDNNPGQVEKYKGGNKGMIGFFMGEIMKASKGKADPKSTNQILQKMLSE